MRVIADKARCTSAGNCARVAPDLFDQQEDDGLVIVLQAEVPPALHDAALEAETLCPAAAISLVDD